MSEQLQGRGWSLGRPAKARLPLSHPRGAVRAEKRGRRPGASREVELAAAHSLAGAGGRGRARPASRLAAGAAAGPPRRPAPEGRPRLRPEQRFLRTPAKQTQRPQPTCPSSGALRKAEARTSGSGWSLRAATPRKETKDTWRTLNHIFLRQHLTSKKVGKK